VFEQGIPNMKKQFVSNGTGKINAAQLFSNLFKGVLAVVRKSRGGGSSFFEFYCIFMAQFF
jgi:hypothetical protein